MLDGGCLRFLGEIVQVHLLVEMTRTQITVARDGAAMGNLENPGARRSFGSIESFRISVNEQKNILDQVIGFRGIFTER
jgi:hypothetical protein